MAQNAAFLFALLAGLVAVFQVALIMGAPWGEFTLGGRWHGTLPVRARALPLASTLLLLGFAIVVVVRAGMAFNSLQPLAGRLVWVVVAFCAVGTVANAMTPSPRERMLWLPVASCMLALSLVVALS